MGTSTTSPVSIILPDSLPLDYFATYHPAPPTTIEHSTFLPLISEEGDRPQRVLCLDSSPLTEYFTRPTDTPLYVLPCSPESYPSDGPVTRTHASRQIHWPDDLLSWIFKYCSVDMDAYSSFPRLPRYPHFGGECWAMHASIARSIRRGTIRSLTHQSSIDHGDQSEALNIIKQLCFWHYI